MFSDLDRSALSDPAWWDALDRRVHQAIRRVARPVRGVMALFSGVGTQLAARAGEVVPDVEVAQHFGFASHPPDGTEAIAVPIGGSSAHLVIVGEIDRTTRPVVDLVLGEAILYSLAGAKVHVKADGTVALNGGGAAVARVGDSVLVTLDPTVVAELAAQMVAAGLVTAGSGSGTPPTGTTASGEIISGSTTVQAGG